MQYVLPAYIKSFVDLQNLLQFYSCDESSVYDPGGIFLLIAACIDNLIANSVEGDFENWVHRFTKPQRALLINLVEQIRKQPCNDED